MHTPLQSTARAGHAANGPGPRVPKSLDRKLAAIHADPLGCKEFIIADAKDADMAFGLAAPGRSPEAHGAEGRFRTLAEYREQIRQIVRQQIVDIMLMSASTCDLLARQERLFDDSPITPAARANDTSDIHIARGSSYFQQPSQPFRTATLDHIQCGHLDCQPHERALGANLGLYSVTLNNRQHQDLETLTAYKQFRHEAERVGFKHFLEVFDPNQPHDLPAEQLPNFINDCIARLLAGVTAAERPVFLKIVYHGPKAMEDLVAYDPHLVVGILGGGAGTTLDAFKLIHEAQKYGAKVALFGRKINQAECQLAFVQFLRLIVEGAISPEDAVRAYHGVLANLKIRPLRPLEDDLRLETSVMSYGGARASVVVAKPAAQSDSPPTAVETAMAASEKPAGCACGGSQAKEAGTACSCHASRPTAETSCACTSAQLASASNGQPHAGRSGQSGHADCGCHKPPTSEAAPRADGNSGSAAPNGEKKLTQKERLAQNIARLDRIFGRYGR